MKMPLRFLLATTMLLSLGTAALAEGFQMDRVTVGAKYVEDEDPDFYQWIYANSNLNYDWMKMNLQGKYYFKEMKENWIDYSPNGMGDLYNGVKATFRFPALSKGFEASLGYEQNHNYDVSMWGAGYGWGFGKDLTMGVRYDEGYRRQRDATALTSQDIIDGESDHPGDLDRRQQEFYLKYVPNQWSYSLDVKRIEKDFVNAQNVPPVFPAKYNDDYSSENFVFDHKLTWQATSKLDLGLRYITTDSDYVDDFKLDGDSQKWIVSGDYKASKYWTYNSALSWYTYEGYDGETSTTALTAKAKYTSDGNWWYAAKLYLYDLYFDDTYHSNYDNAKDKDADYHSRTQQAVAFEYEEKLEKCSYNLEVFVKNYAYSIDDETYAIPDDDVKTGLIGTLVWDWASLHWKLRVAPWGDLDTRKANAELTATYKF